MGIIDDITSAFVDFVEFFDLNPIEIGEALSNTNEPTEALAIILETLQPFDEGGAILVDVVEEFIITPVEQEGVITPDSVELVVDELDGNAAAITAGVIALNAGIETFTAGQVDEVPDEIYQAIAGFGFQDVAGREIDARLQEGIDPALKQKVHREHRSKQADFKDFVDANVRSKRFGGNVPTRTSDIPQGTKDLLHPDDFGWLADPDTYGTAPEQTELFELVGLGVSEPEEIIEEPIQYGIPVPLRPVEALNDMQGFPEDVKSIYREVIDQLPKTENLMQDYARLTEFNFRLREKVGQGALTPTQARGLIEPELRDIIQNALPDDRYRDEDRTADEVVDILAGELERNFKLLNDLPSDPPSQSDIEAWFQKGVIGSQQFFELYDAYAGQIDKFGLYYTESAVDKGWEAVQKQYALERIGTSEARSQLQAIGFTNQEIQRILAGGNGDDIVQQRLQDGEDTTAVPPGALVNIGEAREAALSTVGVETVAEVAQLSVENLVQSTGMPDDEALQTIEQAKAAVEQRSE